MNYLMEINAFRRMMERAPMSHTAQILWYVLMDFDNQLRWKEEFSVDNDRLMGLARVNSRTTLISARKELVDAGLLIFTPGKKGVPSTYRMKTIAAQYHMMRPQEDDQTPFFLCEVKEDITTYFGYTEALGKELKKTTEDLWDEFLPGETPTEADTREVFYLIMEQRRTEGGETIMSFPVDRKRMLARAFEIARDSRAIKWNYIKGIFRNWAKAELHTLEAIYEHEDERDRRRGVS